MNLTISIEDELLRRARELARRRGISLQDLMRGYLESLVGTPSGEEVADELVELLRNAGGRSGGLQISREDAYEGRV